MAFEKKVGNFALTSGTGSQSVTGLGFEPKLVIFYGTRLTIDGVTAHNICSIGAATSASEERCVSCEDKDGMGTTDCGMEWRNDACCSVMQPGTFNRLYAFDLTEMNSDGFIINKSVRADSVAYQICYIALGGSDLSNVKVGDFALETDSQQDVTGIGFDPDCVLFFSALTTNVSGDRDDKGAVMSYGWAAGSSKQGNIGGSTQDDEGTSQCNRVIKTDKCISGLQYNTNTTIEGESDFNSFISGGFRLDHTNTWPSTYRVCYIALKGLQYATGDFDTVATAPTDITESGLSFDPELCFFNHTMQNSFGTANDMRFGFGAASGASEEVSVGAYSDDNQGTSDTGSQYDNDEVYTRWSPSGGITGRVELKSFGTGQFTVTQTDADTINQSKVIWLALGASATPEEEEIINLRGNLRANLIGGFQ